MFLIFATCLIWFSARRYVETRRQPRGYATLRVIPTAAPIAANLFAIMFAIVVAMVVASSVADAETLYVVRRGWHTDVGFAAAELNSRLTPYAAQFPGVQYLFFSFGDQHYLMAKDHGTPAMLGALWPGKGLILATALIAVPTAAFGPDHVIRVTLTPQQAGAAQRFIADSISSTDSLPGPYPGSLYFSAVARYSAVHTCNTWSAEVMNSAGLPVHAGGVIFASQLWRRARPVAE